MIYPGHNDRMTPPKGVDAMSQAELDFRLD